MFLSLPCWDLYLTLMIIFLDWRKRHRCAVLKKMCSFGWNLLNSFTFTVKSELSFLLHIDVSRYEDAAEKHAHIQFLFFMRPECSG